MHTYEEKEEIGAPEEPTIEDPLNPVRQPGEEFWAYKARMRSINRLMKAYSKGQMVWNTKERGTYRKIK
jgi:hypothetical protein